MFANLEASVPKFETRRAMVILNMQNDTFEKREDLVICEPQDFRDTLQNVVPYFRRLGDIVWVKTEFDNSKTSAASPQAAQDLPSVDDNNEEQTARLKLDVEDDEIVARQLDADTIGGYYPNSRTKAAMRKASAKARAEFRQEELDAFVADDGEEEADAYLKKPRKGRSATLYIPGSRGAEFTPDTLANVDEANDLIISKSLYSAFDATPLLVSLRMKLVTHIYLAGAISNISIYATAADAVRHGFEVSVVEDCIGYRSESRHLNAMRKMADMLGVSGIDSEEIIEESGGKTPPEANSKMFIDPGIGGIRSRADLSDPVSKTIRDHLRRSAMGLPPVPTPNSNTEPDRRGSQEDSVSPTETHTMMEGIEKSSPSRGLLGPGDHIGEGDSSILLNALSSSLADNAFKLVKDEVDWQIMRHRSGEVPRRVAVQGESGPNGAVPLYRHPADESPPFLEFTPAVKKIRDELQILLKQPFNHCLIQLYRSGQDNISEHADKTLDIVRGSSIINLSLGAQRSMTLRTKKLAHPKPEAGEHAPRNSQRIRMPHNSVFVLGCRTNAKWLHGVRPDKRPPTEKSEEEKAFGGQRISLTFRHIGTFTDRNRCRIWGQGAKSKFAATAGAISTQNNAEMEAMIIAFGKENQQVDFDWDAEYGEGFDALNLVVTSAQQRTTLYLCNDDLSNLRVKMAVIQRRIPCRMTRSRPTDTSGRRSPIVRRTIFSLSGDENPLFRDNDANQSESVGDLAILFYINRFYPSEPEPDAHVSAREMHRVATNVFARITQANELLFLWQELRGEAFNASTRATHQVRQYVGRRPSEDSFMDGAPPSQAFEGEMEIWEEYAEEAEYISGEVFTIVDCGFWPVLNEVVRRWKGWSEHRYPNLANYWRKIGAMACTRQAILEKGDDGEQAPGTGPGLVPR